MSYFKRLLIAGSRDFVDYEYFKQCCEEYLENLPEFEVEYFFILSGGARGTDTMAEKISHEWGFPFKKYPANWNTNGKFDKLAGRKRNKVMAENCDMALIFWDGKSTGTQNMIQHLTNLDIQYKIEYI